RRLAACRQLNPEPRCRSGDIEGQQYNKAGSNTAEQRPSGRARLVVAAKPCAQLKGASERYERSERQQPDADHHSENGDGEKVKKPAMAIAAPFANASHDTLLAGPWRTPFQRSRLLAGTSAIATVCQWVGIGSNSDSAHMRVASSIVMTEAG